MNKFQDFFTVENMDLPEEALDSIIEKMEIDFNTRKVGLQVRFDALVDWDILLTMEDVVCQCGKEIAEASITPRFPEGSFQENGFRR